MQILKISAVLALFALIGCQNKPNTPVAPSVTTPSVSTSEPATSVSTAPTTSGQTVVEATFVEAVQYASSTDYIFELANKEQLFIRVSSDPENAATNPKVPANLIGKPSKEGGPAGANEAMVGKKFKLTKQDDAFISVEAI